MGSTIRIPVKATMPLFSPQVIAHLGPSNFDGYVERILSERCHDVISELGLTRTEIPFFNVSSDLRHLLVLNKLHEVHLVITTGADKHDLPLNDPSALLQQELSSLVKEVKQGAHRLSTEGLRILDLSYTPNGMSALLLCGHENVEGLSIKLNSVVTNTRGQFGPQSCTQFTVCNVDVSCVDAAQKAIGKCPT